MLALRSSVGRTGVQNDLGQHRPGGLLTVTAQHRDGQMPGQQPDDGDVQMMVPTAVGL